MSKFCRIAAFFVLVPLVAFPLAILFFAPWFMGSLTMGHLGKLVDPDRGQIKLALTSQDIAFGGDADQLLKNLKRLKSQTASIADARVNNRGLLVAIVNLSTDYTPKPRGLFSGVWNYQKNKESKPIDIEIDADIKPQDGSAVLIIADRPVTWSGVKLSPDHRAKIAIEGLAVFDLEQVPDGVLAGFRVAAFGSHGATNPLDLASHADSLNRHRFCNSMQVWASHFQVEMDSVRIWRFVDPERIVSKNNRLSSIGGKTGHTDYVTDICPQIRKP